MLEKIFAWYWQQCNTPARGLLQTIRSPFFGSGIIIKFLQSDCIFLLSHNVIALLYLIDMPSALIPFFNFWIAFITSPFSIRSTDLMWHTTLRFLQNCALFRARYSRWLLWNTVAISLSVVHEWMLSSHLQVWLVVDVGCHRTVFLPFYIWFWCLLLVLPVLLPRVRFKFDR